MWKKISFYIVWILGFQAVSIFIGLQHKDRLTGWYTFLQKSSLTPPGYVFSIVWPLLYVCLAIVGCWLWMSSLKETRLLFWGQMLLNWSWTTVFFRLHSILISWVMILVMILLTLIIIYDLYHKNKKIALLLLPYEGWLLFASYLNLYIWLYN